MLPVIFSLGNLNFYTLGFFLGIGFFISSFTVWRRLRQLGLKEEDIIDGIIFSTFLGLFLARIFFIFQYFSYFKLDFSRWFFILKYPGFSFWGGVGGVVLALILICKKKKWNFWRVADEVVFGILPFLILIKIAAFFDGSEQGKPTVLPWGIFYPGSLVRQHPVALYSAASFLLIWIFLLKIENKWRFWRWYKSQEPGFLFLVFLILSGFFNLGIAFLTDLEVYWFIIEICLSLLTVIISGGILWKKRK